MTTPEKNIKILMIEDDLTLCELVGTFLRKKGYTFVHHTRYEGAYERAREIKPHLIILDLHFPDGNGLHLCKLLKEDKNFSGIPVLVLTTRDYPVEKEIAMTSGATDIYQKPVDLELFTRKINELLGEFVEIIFWGVRGSTPCPGSDYVGFGGNTTCVQINIPGKNDLLILDAGSGIRALGNELLKSKESLTGRIFFTHAHWDHIQGFPFFKPFYMPGNRFEIHMPPQMAGTTRQVLLDQMSYTYFPVTSRMLKSKMKFHVQKHPVKTYDGYRVQYMSANHPVETAIYKIHINNKTIIFSPDNELKNTSTGTGKKSDPFLEQFDDFVRDADLLIHDAQYDLEEYSVKNNWGHSAWELVIDRAKMNNVKRLCLTHYDPDSTDDKLHDIEEKVKDSAGDSDMQVEMAKEGKSYRIPV